MSEKCEHDFTFSTECRCGLDIRDYVAELQSKCDELEDALRLNKAEQDVYRELGKKIAELEKKNKVMRDALEKYADDQCYRETGVKYAVGHELAQQCLKYIE